MTTPEHTLVGIHVALALGLHRTYGWQSIAMAGLASNAPDWDGLPMLIDMQRFEFIHRAWGHGILSLIVTSLILAFTQWRWDWLGRLANQLKAVMPTLAKVQLDSPELTLVSPSITAVTLIAFTAQAIHLPCDMVVSGGQGMSDWGVKPWWPFSDISYIFPLIPWGDIGPTVILMFGVIVMAKYQVSVPRTSIATILLLLGYLLLRGLSRGVFTL